MAAVVRTGDTTRQSGSETVMEKVVVTQDGVERGEVRLEGSRITIGRDSSSTIHLGDLSVSRNHACLVRVLGDYYVEDLGSTNGTFLNDRQVKKHVIRHDDLLRIGNFELRFVGTPAPESDPDRTLVLQPRQAAAARSSGGTARQKAPKVATLRFFRGPLKGVQERIDRALYTIGRPGSEVAAIARRPQGFYLLHIGGDHYPRINSQELTTTRGVQLKEGDVIEVGENLAEISFLQDSAGQSRPS